MKPLCGGGTIIENDASALINFCNPKKDPTKCFAWKKKFDGSEFSFKGCDKLCAGSGEGKDGSNPTLKKGKSMALTTVQGGITMDFKFGECKDFTGNDATCTQNMGGIMDWGEFSPNLSLFSGGCKTIKFSMGGPGTSKKPTLNMSSVLGLVYTQPNWHWSGTLMNKMTEGKKFFREGFFFNQGPISFASSVCLQLGAFKMSNIKKYDATIKFERDEDCQFFFSHESPDCKGGSEGGSGFPTLGTLTLSSICTHNGGKIATSVSRDGDGKFGWGLGMKCIKTGCKASFNSNYQLSASGCKSWGDNVKCNYWFSFPFGTLLSDGGMAGFWKSGFKWGAKMTVDN